jgi:hypothetical protein
MPGAINLGDTRPAMATDATFAWTPGQGSYKHYPPYVNFTGNKLTVRGRETEDGKCGETVAVDLPPEAISGLALAMHQAAMNSDVVERDELLNDIAVMMSEFVDNWPQPKKVKTALALVAKTLRAALDPPKHDFWGAGEPDCPREIKAGNGELHTLRCKACGQDNPRDDRCFDQSAIVFAIQ